MLTDGVTFSTGGKAENFAITGGDATAQSNLTPSEGEHFFRSDLDDVQIYSNGQWRSTKGPVQIDAPADGKPYTRQDNNWVQGSDARGLSTNNPGWRDIISPMISAKLGGSTKEPTFDTVTGGIGAYLFAPSQLKEVFVYYHIDHDYADGTAIYPHIHWCPRDNSIGTVRWGFEFTSARGHQQEAFPASQTIYIEQATTGVADMHMVSEMTDPGLTISNLEPDSIILCRIFRDASHVNDTYSNDVAGFMADIHYQTSQYSTLNKVPNFYS